MFWVILHTPPTSIKVLMLSSLVH
ncbi:hypothetical protein ID866_9882 [Astraeus odoratus]|nr:hypothetical protein ID866_9882 [Astraeus odoratus]